jgi:multicomponent Na+:H+ antiporter subunit E
MYPVLIFFTLMATWVVLSGQFDALHLTLGVISAAFLTWFSGDMLFEDRSKSLGARVAEAARIPGYLIYLFWEILKANLHVLYLALHPRSLEMLEPQIVRFKTKLKTKYARYIFANSITLTPGTVTISIEGDEFVVHAISRQTAESLPGEMENRVAAAFENVERRRG